MNEDKLRQLINDCGLFNSDEDDPYNSSGSEWTPDGENIPHKHCGIRIQVDVHAETSFQAGKNPMGDNNPIRQNSKKPLRLDEQTGEMILDEEIDSDATNSDIETENNMEPGTTLEMIEETTIIKNPIRQNSKKSLKLDEQTGEMILDEEIDSDATNSDIEAENNMEPGTTLEMIEETTIIKNPIRQNSKKSLKLDEQTGEMILDEEIDSDATKSDIEAENNMEPGTTLEIIEGTTTRDVLIDESIGEFCSKEKIVENENIEEQDALKRKGKKRTAKPETWKKNLKIKESIKKHILREIPACRCKCSDKISEKEASRIFDKFIGLSSHTQQNIYLQGCLQETNPERFRPLNSPKKARPRKVFKYYVSLKKKRVVVCQKAFLAIHGIERQRLQRKVQQKEKDITDLRGRQSHSIYNQEVIKKVHDFIKSIPARESHYSRECNKHKKYIDSNLSVAELHRKFKCDNPGIKMTYSKFNEIFNKDFNIAFGLPRKDICATCEKLKVEIDFAAINKDTQKLNALNTEKELHLRKAEVFLKSITKSEADTQNNKLSLCFDYQKNLPLPVTNVSVEYYLRQLWLHNFGIHDLSKNTATMYLYTENYGQKGPNEVLTALADYIKHNKRPEHTHLELFCDNCFSQNKNRYIFTFLDQLCASSVFQKITISYPIPGHSMMPIDRDFALIERKRIKSEKVYTPGYYVDLIEGSRITDKFHVVFLEKNLRDEETAGDRILKIKNYKSLYDPHMKSSIPGISVCRKVRFQKHHHPELSASMTGQNFKKFVLYRVGMGGIINNNLEDCYQGMLPIKPLKLRDIKNLLVYVPVEKRSFYLDLLETAKTSAAMEQEERIDSSEEE